MRGLLKRFPQSRDDAVHRRADRRLRFEYLEERRLLAATFEVRYENNDGAYSLRDAVNLANAATGNDTIIIKDVTYPIDEIELFSALPAITDGVTIYTESGGDVTLDCHRFTGNGLTVAITQSGKSADIWIQNLLILEASDSAFELSGLYLDGAVLYSCAVQGTVETCADEAIKVTGTDASTIDIYNCTILRAQTGILFDSDADIGQATVYNADIQLFQFDEPDGNFYGIKCTGTGNVTIANSDFYNIAGHGIYINGNDSTDLQVHVWGNTIGHSPDPGHDASIGLNGIYAENWRGTYGAGGYNSDIRLFVETVGQEEITHYSTIQHCGGSGILLRDCWDILIQRNDVTQNKDNGIALTADAFDESLRDILLRGNLVEDNDEDGVLLRGTNGGTVQDVLFSYVVDGGFAYVNCIEDNRGHGVAVRSDGARDISGVDVWYSLLQGNSGDGVALCGTSSGNIDTVSVYGSDILANGGMGISLSRTGSGSVYNVDVIECAIEMNANGAISADSSAVYDACFYANDYVDSASPIQLAAGSNDDLAAPVIDANSVWLDDNVEEDYWVVPFSLEAGSGFAYTAFAFQVYAYNPTTHAYSYLTDLTGATDANGNYSTKTDPNYHGILTTALSEDDQVLIVATSDTGDTSEFSNVATVQDTPPRVVGVRAIGSTTITHAFVAAVDDDTQLATVGVPGGMTKVSITFSCGNAEPDEDALTIVSRDGQTTIGTSGVEWSEDDYTATWTLDSTPGRGEWYIVLDENLDTTISGPELDGEWTNPGYFGDETGNSAFPSGDGDEGGDFEFAITILPGDANRDGKVDDLDASILAANWQRTGGATWAQADFNGDGNVNDLDASILASHWQATCWPEPEEEQLLWGGGSLSSCRSALDTAFARRGFADADSSEDIVLGSAEWNALMNAWFAAMAV